MTVAELADELSDLGICNPNDQVRAVNRAVRQLINKGPWDLTLGLVDLCVEEQCVWLPREVGVVLGLSLNGYALQGNNPLWQFVPGVYDSSCCPTSTMTWEQASGMLLAIRQPETSHLCATSDAASDVGARTVVVEGLDLYGNPQSATLTVAATNGCGCDIPNHQPFKLINRIAISTGGSGWVTIKEHDYVNGRPGRVLGVYEPDEVEGLRRVIRLPNAPNSVKSVRLAYKKAFDGVHSLYDHIPLRNPLAIAHMIRAQKFGLEQQEPQKAEYHENKAVQLLQEELFAGRPLTAALVNPLSPQFQVRTIP